MPDQHPDPIACEAIRKLMADYVIFTDNGRIDEFSALFGRNGEFVLPDGNSYCGSEAIAALLHGHQQYFAANPEAAPPGYLRHQMTTINIELAGPDKARAESYFMTVTSQRLDHWGKWIDELVREDNGTWRFAKRVVITDGFDADGWFAQSFSQI